MLCQNLMRLGKDLHTWPQPLESFSKLVKCQGSIVQEKLIIVRMCDNVKYMYIISFLYLVILDSLSPF